MGRFETAFETMDVAISSSDIFRSSRRDTRGLSWHCEDLTKERCVDLHSEWLDLAESANEKNIFQFPWFVTNSLALFCGMEPKIVVIRQDALLVGIVILRRDTGYGKLPVPFWRSVLHHDQFLGTPLVRSGYENAFVAGLCAWLDNLPRESCFVALSKVSANGAVARAIRQHCNSDARQFLTANSHERAAIAPRDRNGVQADDLLSSNRRKAIRRTMQRLAQEGEVSIERLTDASQLDEWTSQFMEMENTGWKRESGAPIANCEDKIALYTAIIAEAFNTGNLHFARLCLNGEPIAYTLDIVCPPTGYCLKSAIDQRYRKFSPGVLMEYETLKYYLGKEQFTLVDSCSGPDNTLLNQLWPDRMAIVDLAIARKGPAYSMIFRCIRAIKTLLSKVSSS